ncbi:MAG: sigma-54-dependent Fis family transcriptional regulator [Victivallales bacterium]|nr:sigma-54-dependent Fis family transcriptional regulator [Victivallales bacterium]
MADILIVDNDAFALAQLEDYLCAEGYSIVSADSGGTALELIRERVFDLMITGLRMPDIDGIALMKMAQKIQSHMVTVVMPDASGMSDAITAMKFGAYDYIVKPFRFDEVMFIIGRALSYEDLLSENKVLRSSMFGRRSGYEFVIGESRQMLDVFRVIEKLSGTNSTVLISGESGTGKKLIARAVHSTSARSAKPFIKVNCQMLPEADFETEMFGCGLKKGFFELAHQGTIFLEGIDATPLAKQNRLLETLRSRMIRGADGVNKAVDVRIIATSDEDLSVMAERNEFNPELNRHLSCIKVEMPPLRKRKNDIPLLIRYFCRELEREQSRRIDFSADAMKLLSAYSWPGNIRQLENLVRRTAGLSESGEIGADDLPQEVIGFKVNRKKKIENNGWSESKSFVPLKEYMKNAEAAYISNVIEHCDGNKESAAEILGVSLATLYRKL